MGIHLGNYCYYWHTDIAYLKNMAFAIILSLSGFTFAYLTAFILFAIEKTIKTLKSKKKTNWQQVFKFI